MNKSFATYHAETFEHEHTWERERERERQHPHTQNIRWISSLIPHVGRYKVICNTRSLAAVYLFPESPFSTRLSKLDTYGCAHVHLYTARDVTSKGRFILGRVSNERRQILFIRKSRGCPDPTEKPDVAFLRARNPDEGTKTDFRLIARGIRVSPLEGRRGGRKDTASRGYLKRRKC